MKRIKETFFHDSNHLQMVSGCKQFTGEDLTYKARKQFLKKRQRQWLHQNIQQKKQRIQKQKQINYLYDQQSANLMKLRGYLQQKFVNKKENILRMIIKENKHMENQRKQSQLRQKQNRIREELKEIQLLNNKKSLPKQFYTNL